MDVAKVEPPTKKMKNPTTQPSLPVSFSSLPNEIVLSCLARIPISYYRSLSLVSKRFYSLLTSQEIYVIRSQIGATEPCLCVNLALPTHHQPLFTLLNPDKTLIINDDIKGKLSLEPVKLSPFYYHIRFSATNVAVGFEFYQIGGTINGKRSRAVRVFDSRSRTWRRAPKMRVAREHAECYFLDGKLYVMGGCRKRKDSNWGEVFDLKIQTWKPLPSPKDKVFKRHHDVVVLGGRLYVITKEHNYAYDPNEGRWKETLELDFDLFYRLSRQNLLNGPSCVIENVMFNEYGGTYWWWHASCNGKVQGLDDLYKNRGGAYRTIQLLNYGGKLVIIWDEWIHRYCCQDKIIWCAVIRLEKRCSDELVVSGKIEWLNIMCTVPESYNLLTCLSVLL